MKHFSVAILLPFAGIALAQFQFFESMFGHPSQQHHQQQQQRAGASQYADQVDAVSCSGYLCPATLDCVGSPVDCPCPNEEDVNVRARDARLRASRVVTTLKENLTIIAPTKHRLQLTHPGRKRPCYPAYDVL
ncbi:hypothetical protein AX14_004334 [Amanita brunnescens Koide BX004]|nr:hypothetical protein AX14_004334 [Amanita brunnescens Koide BX004]